jgi:hypothetical protein
MGKRSEKFPQGEKNHAVGMGKNGRKNFGMVRINGRFGGMLPLFLFIFIYFLHYMLSNDILYDEAGGQ